MKYMFDAHAHIGEHTENAFVCTESTQFLESARTFRHWALGTIPEGCESDIEKLYEAAKAGGHIGEIGLDKRYPDEEKQIRIFKDALSVAKECDRIAVIHAVRCYGTVHQILRDMDIDRFIIHGFTGSGEMAKCFIGLGGIISISPRAERAKSFPSLLSLPFVTETDMKTGDDEMAVLSAWNRKLSMITGRDIEKESERRIREML